MENKVYDAIILWAWSAGLFCAYKISGLKNILILERSKSPAQKLLFSAKWRWNITNKKINPWKDYATDNPDFVVSAFDRFWTWNFMEFLNEEWIEIKEEDNWRILLKSGKVKEFHGHLLHLLENRWIKIMYNLDFLSVKKIDNIFKIETLIWSFQTKNFIIASWWPSFPQLWATGIAIDIAKNFGLKTRPYYPALVWFETEQDFSSLSGSSIIWNLIVISWNDVTYAETGPILFTHRWISGPAVFNASIFMREPPAIGKYKIKLKISDKEITKRLLSFLWFRANKLKEYTISSNVINVRWLDEAKVCWWGVETKNLNSNFECKKIPWLYFIWECVDVIGKTWWYNLQRCWTSWAVCANDINKK